MFGFSRFLVLCAFCGLINADLQTEIKNFRTSSLSSLQQQFNNLFNDVYGHFHRSQTTLRIARQNLYTSASTYPYYRLSDDARKNLTQLLGSLIYSTIDPVIDAVQKTAMSKFYAFNSDEKTVVEQAFGAIDTQLNALQSKDENCTANVTNRKLTAEYSGYITAINNCTRFVSQKFREPINNFTQVHFIALPLINRVVRDLNACSSSFTINRIETCIGDFMKAYCQDESCKITAIINAVKDQAENMISDGRANYDNCLSSLKDKLPANPTYLKDCNVVY